MAKRMTDIVLPDYPFEVGDEVVVLVSGLGATPVMELYVFYLSLIHIFTRAGEYEDISFKLHKGEILSFTGLVGAGRTELMHSIFGLTKPDS